MSQRISIGCLFAMVAAGLFNACGIDEQGSGSSNNSGNGGQDAGVNPDSGKWPDADQNDSSAGSGGSSGAGGNDASAGTGGNSGQGGSSGSGGISGGGTGGISGSGGQAGNGGQSGTGGTGGSSGTGGLGGSSGGGTGGGSGTGGTGGVGGSSGSGGTGGTGACNSTTVNEPESLTLTSTGTMGAEFMPKSGTDQYSQTSPSPITLAAHPYPGDVVEIAYNDVQLTFNYSASSTSPIYPDYYFFSPNALPYSACQGANNVFSHSCLQQTVYDFRCQILGATANCPASQATFTPQGSGASYAKTGSGIHGVLAHINCP